MVAERAFLCTISLYGRKDVRNLSTGTAEDEADANGVLLEELKRHKRVFKMQLAGKLYTRLMRPTSDKPIDREAILTAIKNVEEKKMDASQCTIFLKYIVFTVNAYCVHMRSDCSSKAIHAASFLIQLINKDVSIVKTYKRCAPQTYLPTLMYSIMFFFPFGLVFS